MPPETKLVEDSIEVPQHVPMKKHSSTTAPANNPEVVTKEERKEMVRIIEEAEPPEG